MTDQQIYNALIVKIKAAIPGFEIRYKNKSWSSKVIGFLAWPFNRRYMTNYTTTRYPRVYFPSAQWVVSDYRRAWKILAHEYVHLWDRKQRGWRFTAAYLLPPVASKGRRDIEMRGYAMTLAINYWRYGSIRTSTIERIIDEFVGWSYLKMWPWRREMEDFFADIEGDIEEGWILFDDEGRPCGPYREVRALLEMGVQ